MFLTGKLFMLWFWKLLVPMKAFQYQTGEVHVRKCLASA